MIKPMKDFLMNLPRICLAITLFLKKLIYTLIYRFTLWWIKIELEIQLINYLKIIEYYFDLFYIQ